MVGVLVVVVVVVVVVLPQIQTFLPSQHWLGPVVVVGHTGVDGIAPPGRHAVLTHSFTTEGQKSGGTQPHGACVVVGRGVGAAVVAVVLVAKLLEYDISQVSQAGPATQAVS